MIKPLAHHAPRLAAIILVSSALIFLLARVIIPATSHMTHGFISYYTAAHLLAQGKLGPQAYDKQWFIAQAHALVNQPIDEVMTYNLPTVSLLALPLAGLPPATARAVWIWLNLLALFTGLISLMITARLTSHLPRSPLTWRLIFTTFALLFPPVIANFLVGQVYIFIFCLFALALWGLAGQRHWLVGLALGLAFVLKTSGLPLWLLLVMQRRWAALGWGIGVVLALTGLSLPWVGLDIWRAYPGAVWSAAQDPLVAVTAYQTTYSYLTHLFRFDPLWNPAPLADWPILAKLLNFGLSGLAMGLTLWRGRQAALPHFFAALTPLSIILLPIAEEHQFVLLLIPIFILAGDLLRRATYLSIDGVLLALALCLLVAPIPYYTAPALSNGWLALLAYPRLYGAWLLWLVALRRMVVAEAANVGSRRTEVSSHPQQLQQAAIGDRKTEVI